MLTQILPLLADPLSVLAGCWWAAGGEEGDPGHYPVASGAPRAAVTGTVPLWSAAVRASRDREDLAGKSRGNDVHHDIPQVRNVWGGVHTMSLTSSRQGMGVLKLTSSSPCPTV